MHGIMVSKKWFEHLLELMDYSYASDAPRRVEIGLERLRQMTRVYEVNRVN